MRLLEVLFEEQRIEFKNVIDCWSKNLLYHFGVELSTQKIANYISYQQKQQRFSLNIKVKFRDKL